MLAALLPAVPFTARSVDFHALAPELVLTGASWSCWCADLFTLELARPSSRRSPASGCSPR